MQDIFMGIQTRKMMKRLRRIRVLLSFTVIFSVAIFAGGALHYVFPLYHLETRTPDLSLSHYSTDWDLVWNAIEISRPHFTNHSSQRVSYSTESFAYNSKSVIPELLEAPNETLQTIGLYVDVVLLLMLAGLALWLVFFVLTMSLLLTAIIQPAKMLGHEGSRARLVGWLAMLLALAACCCFTAGIFVPISWTVNWPAPSTAKDNTASAKSGPWNAFLGTCGGSQCLYQKWGPGIGWMLVPGVAGVGWLITILFPWTMALRFRDLRNFRRSSRRYRGNDRGSISVYTEEEEDTDDYVRDASDTRPFFVHSRLPV